MRFLYNSGYRITVSGVKSWSISSSNLSAPHSTYLLPTSPTQSFNIPLWTPCIVLDITLLFLVWNPGLFLAVTWVHPQSSYTPSPIQSFNIPLWGCFIALDITPLFLVWHPGLFLAVTWVLPIPHPSSPTQSFNIPLWGPYTVLNIAFLFLVWYPGLITSSNLIDTTSLSPLPLPNPEL